MPEITIHVSEPVAEYLTAEAKRRGAGDTAACAAELLEQARLAARLDEVRSHLREALADPVRLEWDPEAILQEALTEAEAILASRNGGDK